MNPRNRHATQAALAPHLTNDWGARILSQLLYLEEVNHAHDGTLNRLLDDLTAQLAAEYTRDGAITGQSAAALEDAMRPASALAKSITVSCVAHAHIDMNWQWRYDETAMLTVDTLRTMLALMEEYPAFTFAQSQASVYQIIADYAPELLPAIRARIREGRWEVTASHWVETDKNMPNGESLTRHLLYTRQYLKDLLELADDQFEIDFEPDTFGHGANVPEILRSGGVKYMYHCRGYDGHSLYRWQSPSGAQVTVYREPTWYNETITAESFRYVPGFCAQHGLNQLIHVYGVGNHGGGATRRDIERILDYSTWPCMPTLTFGRYIDFFRYLDTLDLPVVTHELNCIFDGCYSSQSRIKKANRVAEEALHDAELFNTVSQLCAAHSYDAPAFGQMWRNVLFNQFHDILPGSCTIDAREHALGLFQQTMAGAGTRKSAALRGICSRINTAALLSPNAPPRDCTAEGAGAGFGVADGFHYSAASPAGGKQRLFVLFNPSQVTMQKATTLTVWDWEGDIQKLKITDETGRALEHELIDQRKQTYWGHQFFRVSAACELPPFGYRTLLLEEAASFQPTVCDTSWRVETAEDYTLENEYVKAVFDPKSAALVSFTDKQTGCEYISGHAGLRYIEEDAACGMTSWRVGRHRNSAPVPAVNMARISGKLARQFKFKAAVQQSTLEVTVSLDQNARHLSYDVNCDWREFGVKDQVIPQLAFCAPLAQPCETFTCDNAFGVISRGVRNDDLPGQSFAFAPQGQGGLMLSSDSKYGFRCTGDSLALTLIRSSCDPDPVPEIYTHAFQLNVGIVPNAAAQTLLEAARQQTRTAIAVPCGSQTGNLPLSGSFLRVTQGEAMVSAIKMPEDGSNAVIIRLYDASGKGGQVALELFQPAKAAAYLDAHENELAGNTPQVRGSTVLVDCRANGVAAVKIWMAGP